MDKCKVLHISANDNPRNKYYLDGTELLSTESEKDLGFIMDEKFDFSEHIKASLAKANKMIAWVSRNVICKDKIIMATIYRCLVRPHLEYCVPSIARLRCEFGGHLPISSKNALDPSRWF